MTAALSMYLRQALARLTKAAEAVRLGGAGEGDPALSRLRLLEDLIKEQMPHEDAGSSTRAPR